MNKPPYSEVPVSSPMRRIRFFNKSKQFFHNPIHVISIISLLFLFYTIVVPLWEIIVGSFKTSARDSGAEAGAFTLDYWQRMFGSEISKSLFYQPMLNSLSVAVGVSILSLLIGGSLAWLVTRSDFKYKKAVTFLALLPYMLPSWVMAFAWISVFKNDRIGGSQGIIQSFFHIQPPDWIAYGYLPIVITLTFNYFTFFFLLISVALSSINSSLEEMAEIIGASKLMTLRKITFPLVMPAIISGFILTFSKSLGSFSVPAFLGLPTKYYTISTMLNSSMQNRMISEAYILSIVLLMLCAFLIFFNQKAIGKRKSFETIGGKDARKSFYLLGKWKRPLTWIVLGFMAIVAFVPVIILVLQSFMMMDGRFLLDNFTTHFWIGDSNPFIASGEVGILKNDAILSSIKNSLLVAFLAAICASIIGLLFGYVIAKGRKNTTAKLVEQLSFLPYLIPGIAFSSIYLSMFAKPSMFLPALYGSISLIILISIVNELPFATRVGASTMYQISGELEEAGRMQGASWLKRFMSILLPLSRRSLFSSFLLLFISVIKELDLIILLVTPQTGTIPTLMFRYAQSGFQQYANALMLIIVVIIFVTYYIATKIGKVDFTKGIGG
ncbi:ABC transporter permease [Niallia sp. 03091]|uniref:ABC transporter permease n=1 Tax=unclassified Niallia TaxID=2837522 RepID=UPI0040448D14